MTPPISSNHDPMEERRRASASRWGHWSIKFVRAFRGIYWGVHGQSSFFVHTLAAAGVTTAGALLRITAAEWLAVTLAITLVLTAELFNSALEHLARAFDVEHHPSIGAALDIASGAVLLASIGAATVGTIVFLPRIIALG